MQRRALSWGWLVCIGLACACGACGLAFAPVMPARLWRPFVGALTLVACGFAAAAGRIGRALERIEDAQKDETRR